MDCEGEQVIDKRGCDTKLEMVKDYTTQVKDFTTMGFGNLHEDIMENKKDMKEHMGREEGFYKILVTCLIIIFSSLFGYVYHHTDDDGLFQKKIVGHIHDLELKMVRQPQAIADEVIRRLKEKD